MAGSNLATLLAFTLSIALAASMGYRPGAPPAVPGDPAAVPAGPAATA